MHSKPLVLIILDGWGMTSDKSRSGPYLAKTANMDNLWKKYPHTQLHASGEHVGLPKGNQGTSEVGHLNIGAGKVVYQSLVRINNSIKKGDFFKNKEFIETINSCKKHNSTLHLMGLLQDQGVHAHQEHLFALMKLAKQIGMKKDKVAVHVFTDGRDTLPKSSEGFVKRLQEEIKKIGIGHIATIIGRYYAMDRDKRWKRTQLAYDLLNSGKGTASNDPLESIKKSHKEGITDEFIKPVAINGYNGVNSNDAIIFYNFRWDRARQITKAFTDEKFKGFRRNSKKITYVCMTEYYTDVNAKVAFKPINMGGDFPRILSKHKLKQLRVAETEKYAHVTFFFNGLVEKPLKGEDRILVPSNKKVPTYDYAPEMKAYEITDAVIKNISKYDVIICNFANSDMVGHTGVKTAIIKACKIADECMGRIVQKVLQNDGIAIVTSDHGNCEKITEDDGSPNTAHTTNKVPFILVGNKIKVKLKQSGMLSNIAPTMLDLLHIKKPKDMEKSLIV
ncbi:MAG TPA: 2,3-bisphosphoglycerate-independent phosphoglycerate mutase [Candidatus Nanoarchaeia archaeon]|nr:2,3-bisphosphoglycerate-independent phosphoglycerate mutase [Candidatus Nanoarchaeia archaeon]